MFILKLIDKVATTQFHSHIEEQNLLHERQSGFRRGHSTETALLDLQIQLLDLLERGQAGLLVLLDLSAAFDLLDQDVLVARLKTSANCSPEACSWIHSFLSGRRSSVYWGDTHSESEPIMCGVPQGSCLSPSLFNIYTAPLFHQLEASGVSFTNYADDTQLLLRLTGNHACDNLQLESTYHTIKTWMDSNWMCLNAKKTELMVVASKHKKGKLGPLYNSFSIDGNNIGTASKVKTLGVVLDEHLTMDNHISHLVSSISYQLKLLRQVSPFLAQKHRASIARATILSRLDYCNALLANTSKTNLSRLQVLQNDAVRIACGVPKREHISKKRRELHWLPIKERVNYKLMLLTHKCIARTAPKYLIPSITQHQPTRPLRSSNTGLLATPRFTKAKGNGRSFTTTAPKSWNQMPAPLRLEKELASFKKMLKTSLFRVSSEI